MKWLKYISAIFGCLFLTACLRMTYQPRGQYLLSQDCPTFQSRSVKFKGTVLLDRTLVQSPFSGSNFVYRTSDENYLIDYYNLFLATPSEQLTSHFNQCLTKTKLFSQIVESASISKPNYWLNTKVLELYADYRNRSAPKGILTIHFELYQENVDQNQTLKIFDKTYQEAIPLPKKDSVNLVNAWDEGLKKALQALEADLARVSVPAPAALPKTKNG